MASRGGISGIAVGVAAAGGVLLYAALRDVSPLQAIKDIASGSPEPVKSSVPSWANSGTGVGASNLPGYGQTGGGGVWAVGDGPNAWLAKTAVTQIGVPYVWGGNTPSGFDCSGLVQWSFAQNGISAPRTTYTQVVWSKLRSISRAQVAAGDLIYSSGHVVIALNNTTCVAAQHTGTNVKTLAISAAFSAPIIAYKRYIGSTTPSGAHVPAAGGTT